MERYDFALEKWEKLTEDAQVLQQELSAFALSAGYHSAKLENPAVSFCALRELLTYGTMGDYALDSQTRAQISGVAAASRRMIEAMQRRELPQSELALQINTMLSAGSGAVYGIKPGLSASLRELFEEVNAYKGPHVLKAGTYLHGALLFMNPFDRFNGRTARILANCYLVAKGHPPVVIFCYDRKIYCECVAEYFEREELTPLFHFMQYETGCTWANALRHAPAGARIS